MKADRIAQDYITDPKTGDKIHISTVRLPRTDYNGNYKGTDVMFYYSIRHSDTIEGHQQAVQAVYESFNKEIGDNQNAIP